MPFGLSAALVLLADTAANATAPAAPPAAKAPVSAPRQDGCTNPDPKADTTQIVICAPKPQGYRLNSDVMEARRMARGGGRPTRPGPIGIRNYNCAVGPQGCAYAGINLIGAALTAAEMASRVAQGKEIGSMFATDPQMDEYQYYKLFKARREAHEAEVLAAKKAKADAATKAAVADAPAPAPVGNQH